MTVKAVGATRVAQDYTCGEMFPDGTAIELVADPSDSRRLSLLLWDGTKSIVAPQIEHRGRRYEPISLEPSVVRAVIWPASGRDYGSTRELFNSIVGLIAKHFGFSESLARLLVHFIFATWFSDRLTLAPSLAIVGLAIADGIRLLRFLRCVCRRSLLLAEVSRSDLLSLPLLLCPTLLLDRPKLTGPLRRFMATSNRRGLAAVRGGRILEVCCPKVFHFGTAGVPQGISSGVIQVTLPPGLEFQELGDDVLHAVAIEFQGKLLGYRISKQMKFCVSRLRGTNFTREAQELAMNLAACIVDDAELAVGVVPLMLQQDEHLRQQLDHQIEAAIVEAVLACCHENEKDRVQVKEVAALANTILCARGEVVEYSPEEVAHRLDALELFRTRTSAGSFLILSRETREQVHALAWSYGVPSAQKSMPGCANCQRSELAHLTVV